MSARTRQTARSIVRQDRSRSSGLASLSPGLRRTPLIAAAIVLLTACGSAQDTPTPVAPPAEQPTEAPEDVPEAPPQSDGDEDEDLTALYEYCETAPLGDPQCYTSAFGNNREAADNFLEGPDVGPGGLVEMTATDEGFPAGSTVVGSPVALVNATWTVDIREVGPSEGACEALFDPTTHLGVTTDLDGRVQAFLIANPVVETDQEIRIGSTLAELQAEHDVTVEQYGLGKIAYTVREDVASHYDGIEPSRAMLFMISPDDVIEMWVVGATSYVAGVLTEARCPA